MEEKVFAMPRIGEKAPNSNNNSGEINFIGPKEVGNPVQPSADFTPVCTSEFMTLQLESKFNEANCNNRTIC